MSRRPLGWDITLTLLTSVTLAAFGILCLFGMFHYKYASTGPSWSIAAYQMMMNRLAAPLTILLILWLVLCIPKRLFSRKALAAYSAAVVGLSVAAYPLLGLAAALSIALLLSSALQMLILLLVVLGANLRFSRRGLAVRLGSSLIHLGFVLFVLDLVMLRESAWHIPLFWVGTVLMTGGCALTFYFPRIR